MGLCQYVDLCFHALFLPCLHTFWHTIPTFVMVFFIFLSMSHVHNQLKRKKLLAEVAAVGYGRKKQVKLLAEMGAKDKVLYNLRLVKCPTGGPNDSCRG